MLKKIFLFVNNSLIFISFLCLGDATKFVVVIPSYNNEKWCLWNINSVLNQNYDNFEVIYINDCSTDKTLEIVQNYVDHHEKKDKVKIINRKNRCGSLNNVYDAVHMCDHSKVIVTVDGDDALVNKNVLSYLDSIYQDKNIWLTYGQHITKPGNIIGSNVCRRYPNWVLRQNAFRSYPWVTSQLRTFYVWLFKKIEKKDLLINGKFFDSAGDAAIIYPMLEMSSNNHIKFIDKVLYIYNVANPINDFRLDINKQLQYDKILKKRMSYDPL